MLREGFNLIGTGRGRLVFGKPGSPLVYKVSWRKERTKVDMNETEWSYYNSLTTEQKELVVPLVSISCRTATSS